MTTKYKLRDSSNTNDYLVGENLEQTLSGKTLYEPIFTDREHHSGN